MTGFLTIHYVDYAETASEKTFGDAVFVKGLKTTTINMAEIQRYADSPYVVLGDEDCPLFQPYDNNQLPFCPRDVQSRIHTKDGKTYDVLESRKDIVTALELAGDKVVELSNKKTQSVRSAFKRVNRKIRRRAMPEGTMQRLADQSRLRGRDSFLFSRRAEVAQL